MNNLVSRECGIDFNHRIHSDKLESHLSHMSKCIIEEKKEEESYEQELE